MVNTMETTYVMIKPDGVQRGLISEIIGRFERKGLKLVGLKAMVPTEEIARSHYDVHKERPFFPGLIKFVTSGPVVCMAWEGVEAIAVARKLIGATNGRKAAPGTIRGDLGMSFSNNLVHGSDGEDTAKTELALWFADEGELMDWSPSTECWVYNVEEELGG